MGSTKSLETLVNPRFFLDYRNTRASFDHPSTTPPIRAPLSTMAFGAALVLGIYSYFLSVLADKNIHIPAWEKAVEGMSGAACLYLIFCVLLTLFLGGIRFFAFIAIVLDICFVGCFAAIAYYPPWRQRMQRRRQHSPRHGPQRRGRSWSWRLGLCVQLEHGLLRRVYCQHLPLSRHRRCPVPSRPPPPEGEALRPKPIQQLHQRNRSSSILEAQPRGCPGHS